MPGGCTSIEHAYPFAKIRENQERLLNYLNNPANNEVRDAFLAVEAISDFFGRDEEGQVRGTLYFYKLCYNAIQNLFLMCQSCNANKSAKDPIAWFGGSTDYFGQPFLDHLEELGNWHEGVLFIRVYQIDPEESPLPVRLSSQEDPEDPTSQKDLIMLPSNNTVTQGLGKVVRKWFLNTYGSIFKAHRDFYNNNYELFKEHLRILRENLAKDDIDGIVKQQLTIQLALQVRKEMRTLTAIQKELVNRHVSAAALRFAAVAAGSPTSDSSDNSQVEGSLNRDLIEDFKNDLTIKHATHRIRTLVKILCNEEVAARIFDYCHSLSREFKIPGDNWLEVLANFKLYATFKLSAGDKQKAEIDSTGIEQEIISKILEFNCAEDQILEASIRTRLEVKYAIREISLLVNASYGTEIADEIFNSCYSHNKEFNLSGNNWLNILVSFRTMMEAQRLLAEVDRFSKEQLKQKLEQLMVENTPLLQAQRRAEEERQQKEQAKQEREQERQQKEQERHLREQAEQETEKERQRSKQLEQQIAQLLLAQKSSAQPIHNEPQAPPEAPKVPTVSSATPSLSPLAQLSTFASGASKATQQPTASSEEASLPQTKPEKRKAEHELPGNPPKKPHVQDVEKKTKSATPPGSPEPEPMQQDPPASFSPAPSDSGKP
ncbi:MAG: hypothetical protein K0R12_1010 [Gammaproteobacteria bacterium]|nr:hypothetical protein [Gammaproteobacteria bacterium]